MKATLLIPVLAACAFAQEQPRVMHFNYSQAGTTTAIAGQIGAGPVGVGAMLGEAVKGAPYSATIVTEMIQTLADGNRISQKSQGAVARDSQGRMRHEAILPAIGNMSAANPPKMVFINDPLSGTTYSLNAADKTYRKMPAPQAAAADKMIAEKKAMAEAGGGGIIEMRVQAPPPPAGAAEMHGVEIHTMTATKVMAEQSAYKNESLGSKVIDGVMAEGTRSTRTIPAGEIGNEKPIDIVSESWFSSELKTVIYTKRSDPRSGDMVYSLTNISRAEPDASLFAVPADYKAAADGGGKDVIFYKQHED